MEKQIKKLYRSRKDRVIFGVCGGLAQYFNIDPVFVRIIFVAMFFGMGSGLLLYLLLAIIIPLEPGKEEKIKKTEFVESLGKNAEALAEEVKKADKEFLKNLLGLGIVFVGIMFLFRRYFDFYIDGGLAIGFFIVIIGFYLMTKKK